MASTPTTRNRLEKQGAGENASTWGAPKLNTLFDLTDTSLDGWTTKALTTNVTLTSTNYAADESRARILKFTGTGAYQVTIPSVEKWYIVANRLTGNVTVTTGGGTTIVVEPNETAIVICDGSNLIPLGYATQSIKAYIDAKAPAARIPVAVVEIFCGTSTGASSITAGFGGSRIVRNGGGDFSLLWGAAGVDASLTGVPIVSVTPLSDSTNLFAGSMSAAGVSIFGRQGDGVTARDNFSATIIAYVP